MCTYTHPDRQIHILTVHVYCVANGSDRLVVHHCNRQISHELRAVANDHAKYLAMNFSEVLVPAASLMG